MEKLIELFNEYEKPQTNHIYTAYEVKENINRLDILQEFVEWLVDNDKIDLEELTAQAQEKIRLNLFGYKDNKELDTDLLLMLLSIQDNPIEFLISILR